MMLWVVDYLPSGIRAVVFDAFFFFTPLVL